MVLKALHNRGADGPAEGIGGLLRRYFRAWNLSSSEIGALVADQLPGLEGEREDQRLDDVLALTVWMSHGEEDQEERLYRFSGLEEKAALFERFLRRVARDRAVVMVVDNLQWAEEAQRLVELVLAATDLALLIVTTVRSDEMEAQNRLVETLEQWAQTGSGEGISLGPLSSEEQEKILDQMLPLGKKVRTYLLEKTEGNPLFAFHILSEWIADGLFSVGPEGLVLKDGEVPELAKNIHQIWEQRLQRLVRRYGQGTQEQLELAATLGQECVLSEWVALGGKEESVARWVKAGLVKRWEGGFSFSHGLLVASLKQFSRESGRGRSHHRRCAEMLDLFYWGSEGMAGQRIGEHWIAAGEMKRALAPLLARCEWLGLHESGRPEEWVRCCQRHRDVLDILGIPEGDRQRLESDLMSANIELRQGRRVDALQGFREVYERAVHKKDSLIAARAAIALSQLEPKDDERRRHYGMIAIEWARDAGDSEVIAKALGTRGIYKSQCGDFHEAKDLFESALVEAAKGRGSKGLIPYFHYRLGLISMHQGELEKAYETFLVTLTKSKDQQLRALEGSVELALGDLEKYWGKITQAEKRYRRSQELARQRGYPHNVAADLNLVQVFLAQRDWRAAEDSLGRAREALNQLGGSKHYETLMEVLSLALAVGTQDREKRQELWDAVQVRWAEKPPGFVDYPWLLELSGELAAEHGEVKLARELWSIGRDWAKNLKHRNLLARIEEKLDVEL